MSRLSLLLIAALAASLAAPSASAFEITFSGLDSQPPALGPGESHDHTFGVAIASTADQNIICATEGKITLTLTPTKTDSSLGLDATVEPSSVDFTIPAGAYLGASGTVWSGPEQSGTITISVGDALPPGHESHTFGIKAAYDGTIPSNCQGDFKEADGEGSLSVPLKPPAAEEPDTTPTDGGAESPVPTEGTGAEESPLPGFVIAFGALGLAGLLRRRNA